MGRVHLHPFGPKHAATIFGWITDPEEGRNSSRSSSANHLPGLSTLYSSGSLPVTTPQSPVAGGPVFASCLKSYLRVGVEAAFRRGKTASVAPDSSAAPTSPLSSGGDRRPSTHASVYRGFDRNCPGSGGRHPLRAEPRAGAGLRDRAGREGGEGTTGCSAAGERSGIGWVASGASALPAGGAQHFGGCQIRSGGQS